MDQGPAGLGREYPRKPTENNMFPKRLFRSMICFVPPRTRARWSYFVPVHGGVHPTAENLLFQYCEHISVIEQFLIGFKRVGQELVRMIPTILE